VKPKSSLFRTWLVDRVSDARLYKRKGQTLAERSRYLGVQPDVLEEADQLRQRRLEEVGRFGSRRGVHTAQYHGYTRLVALYVPEKIAIPLDAVCAARHIEFADLARAVVQTLLSGPNNPRWCGKGWLYKGRRLPPVRSPTGKRSELRKFAISVGADIALGDRAERLGVTKTGLIRGALCDVVEGRMKRLIYTDTASMWNDPARYWIGDLKS
jgi:hypothetical protein